MTMLIAMGAENNSILDFDSIYGGAISEIGKRTGSYSYRISAGEQCVKNLPAAKSEIYVQFSFYLGNTACASVHLFKWMKGSTVLGSLYFDSTLDKLKFYTGDAALLVATSTKVLNSATLYLIELHIKLHDSTGVLEARIDGIADATLTFSGDTKPGADADIDKVMFIGGDYYFYFDDIIVNDTAGSQNKSWPGGARIVRLGPTGAGSSTQWTPSTGSNYQTVDELPPVMTDYNSVATDGQLDLFALADLPAEAASILAIIPEVFALKEGLTLNNLKTAYKNSGESTIVSANHALPTSMAPISDIIEINPDTSAAFTPAEINALEVGYQSAT